MPHPYQSPIAVDTHTHTVVSGHAWSTFQENIAAAISVGLKGLVSTEHGHRIPGTVTQLTPDSFHMLPKEYDGLRLFYGMEFNILDFDGHVDDYSDSGLSAVQFGIASMHGPTMRAGNASQYTDAYIASLSLPYIDILGHPGSAHFPCDIDAVVAATKKENKLIEINNNTFGARPGSEENCLNFAKACKAQDVRICVSSDSHFSSTIGHVDKAWALLQSIDFPSELIVNLTLDRFEAFLAERAAQKAQG